MLGDFNLITNTEDRNNGNINRAMMGRFPRLVNDLELRDFSLHGRKFTWSNPQDTPTLVKLDRAYAQLNGSSSFKIVSCAVKLQMGRIIAHFSLG